MAKIFLSYDREDDARARPIAILLERAGHSVWWDRQIKGGGEFGAEIEAALNAADKIIVLWSRQSIKSAWVRDEASVGRDTGRLVPVTIDGTPAPLGFRQFQTIDLSKWRGRGSSPEVKDLLDALGQTSQPARPQLESRLAGFRFPRPLLIGGGAIIATAAVAIAAWQFWPMSVGTTPTFVIVPADPSPTSKQLASDVATRIAAIDDPSGADFHIADAGSAQGGNRYALKVAAGSPGGRQTLTLVSAGKAILWSSPLDIPPGNSSDFSQAVALSAQRALSCAADILSYRREKIDQETLKLYLSGCTRYDGAYGTNSPNTYLVKTFKEVIDKAPHFVPAWSKLFALECEDAVPGQGREALLREIPAQLARIQQLGIEVPEAHAVRVNLLSPADYLGIFRVYDEGIAKHPDNALLLRLRGERYTFVGRMSDAVSDASQAAQLDPLSPASQQSYASTLAYAGNIDAGYAQLRKAEALWPNSATVDFARYRLDLRFGDPREARQLYLKYASELGQNAAQAKFIEARINPTPQNIEAALEPTRRINRQFPPFIADLIQVLAQFGRKDEAIDLLVNYPGGRFREWIGYNSEVLFRPMMRDVWRDPRSIAGAAHVGLLRYWKVSGKWPDFCFDPTLPYDCKKEAAKYRD
jgi:tetratricopeptide (TPR) repeat protein